MSFSFVFPLVGGSSGGGTVSSVGLSMPTDDFNIANSPVTGSDTIAVTYKSQIQNLIFGSPDGITGTPLFRYLVGADLPSATTSVKGALPIATDAEALAGSITDKIIVPETLSYTFLNRQIGAITAINSAILATDTINGAFAKAQGQINAKQNTLTVGDITGSEFSITGGVGAVIGTGVSLSLAASGVTANTYGSSTIVPVVTVNSKGIITGVTTASIAFPPSSVTSVFGRSGAVTAQSGDYTFAQISSTPTTLAGYGITDAITTGGSGSVSDISITGLAGSGFLNLRYQSSVPIGLVNYGTLYADSIGNIGYKKNANAFTNSLSFSGTADRVYTFQDRSGTLADNFDLALKLDLSGGNANQDIDIGNFSLNTKHVKINGTGGAGHIGLKHQSADISASASESSIGADSVGDPVWKNDGGAIDKLELQSNKTSTVTGNEASITKYLTVKGVYDWAVGLFAPKASPTFTGTVTTPDIIVSGATVNTIAHFDASKNIESLPTATYPSLTELSYVKGVTSSIQTQLNASSTAYAIPNYYRVDLNLGDDSTGIAGREDKPYKLIQTVWDLIPVSSKAQITIEIVGDYTFTTHALLTSVLKDNITFLFRGKITYAVPATTGSRPLFTFSQTNNNITFIIPNYTQTTQGGFIYTAQSTGHRYIIDNMQILLGVNTSTVNNYGITILGSGESLFTCNNLTISLANDASGIAGYGFLVITSNVKINTLKITGTPTVALNFYGFTGPMKSLNIENLITDNGYTNLNYFGVTYALTVDNVLVQNINVASDGSTQKSVVYALFKFSSCKNLTIMSGSILNYGMITTATTTLENLNLGNLSMNGVIGNTSNPFTKNLNLLGNITKTVASQSADKFLIWIESGAIVNGNGFKITHTDPTFISTTAIFMISGSASAKTTFINNLTIYNSNTATGSTQPFVPIMYTDTNTKIVRLRNVVISSQIDTNSNANATFMRPYNANTSYTCTIEGNVATNYLQNVTNLTNDADIDLINGYTL